MLENRGFAINTSGETAAHKLKRVTPSNRLGNAGPEIWNCDLSEAAMKPPAFVEKGSRGTGLSKILYKL